LVVDANGKFVSSNTIDVAKKPVNQDVLKNHNFSEEPWFKAVKEGKTTDDKENAYAGTHFQGLFKDNLQELAFGEARVASGFSTAIRSEAGDFLGVITNRAGSRWLDTEFVNLYTQMKNVKEPSARLVLLDGAGNQLIAHEPEAQGGKNEVTYNDRSFTYNYAKEGFEFAQRLLKDENSFGNLWNPEGKHFEVIGFSKMIGPKWPKMVNWSVAVSADETDAFEELILSRTLFYSLSGVFALLSVMFTLWVANRISNSVTTITENVNSETQRIAIETQKIAESSAELSSGATEQASAIQETMAAIDEINATVEKNADSAERSKHVSAKSRDAAVAGKQNVEDMIQSISQISHSNETLGAYMAENNRKLSEITGLIQGIEEKTKVINDIVFQTKLLSFNASVEAARAGEYGKGFAVVAEEVGNLAQMSGQAAKEIFTILGNSVQRVQSIVTETKTRVDDLMNTAKSKVQLGTMTANKCKDSLDIILQDVQAVDALVTEIAVASREQAKGVSEISKAVGQLDQVTQQNTSVAQTSASTVAHLNSQTTELSSLVKDMFTLIKGGTGEVKIESAPNNVTAFRTKPQGKVEVRKTSAFTVSKKEKSQVSVKQAAGGEAVPSFNDPGFEDV
jgi:methyl-accepting chemotaxis protein